MQASPFATHRQTASLIHWGCPCAAALCTARQRNLAPNAPDLCSMVMLLDWISWQRATTEPACARQVNIIQSVPAEPIFAWLHLQPALPVPRTCALVACETDLNQTVRLLP